MTARPGVSGYFWQSNLRRYPVAFSRSSNCCRRNKKNNNNGIVESMSVAWRVRHLHSGRWRWIRDRVTRVLLKNLFSVATIYRRDLCLCRTYPRKNVYTKSIELHFFLFLLAGIGVMRLAGWWSETGHHTKKKQFTYTFTRMIQTTERCRSIVHRGRHQSWQ